MKRSLLFAALFSTGLVFSVGIPMASAATPAAPELKGFGTDTIAGSGGRIIRVTTLASSGAGSLREALAAKGPRIIVFEVGGIIDLNKSDLRLSEPFVTIAGQTAPSPGITIIRGGMGISTHDVLMQHIRFRIGDAGTGKKSGFERDVSINGKDAYNVVIDHSSFAWGTDENLSISGPRYDGPQGTAHRITLSNNIVAEGLYDSAHTKGIHSMGTLVHDNVTDVSIVGSLYAHNNERNAWFKAGSTGVMVNNLIYNPGIWGVRVGGVKGEWEGKTMPASPRVSVAGNVMHYGANTKAGLGLVGSNSSGDVWMSDNLAYDAQGKTAPQTSGSGINLLKVSPIWPAGLTASPASAVTNQVLQSAGARPKDRDAVDKRIVENFKQRKGGFVNSQEDVGGYPVATATYRQLNVPSTGVDAWLQQMAKALE
ncbi:pectate lyase PelZ [Pectobacterium carotovorum]|uniref:pectate lyase PelZ n=1 Tax=Pectobacterium carotovorum TaxID=554 RepID=UPI00057FA1A2|nr:pectate lyase PelZ [Pectobacterium carotovorum]KHT24374.1 pectate lyase [Pectobacterium carotovorum subsp. carotovorum]